MLPDIPITLDTSEEPKLENLTLVLHAERPKLENPRLEKPMLDFPMQLNKEK